MVGEFDGDKKPNKPTAPQFSLRALLTTISGLSLLLAFAVKVLPRWLGSTTGGIVFIVAFAAYPFVVAGVAERIGRYADDRRLAKIFSAVLGTIGVIPGFFLNYPQSQIPMVAPIAALVLVLCFTATGGLIGSLLDLRNSSAKRID